MPADFEAQFGQFGPYEMSADLTATRESIVEQYSAGEPYEIESAEERVVNRIPGIDVRVNVLGGEYGVAVAVFSTDEALTIVEFRTADGGGTNPNRWDSYEEVISSLKADD